MSKKHIINESRNTKKPTTDAKIRRAVASDPDTFIPNAKWFAQARVVLPENKEAVTLRLDPDILKWFKHHGRGYQTRINAVLRAFVESQTYVRD